MVSDDTSPDTNAQGARRQVEDIYLHEVGQRLIDLGEQLRVIGQHTENGKLRDSIQLRNDVIEDEVTESVDREIRDALRRTLTGLGSFRKDYSNWERLVVEFALTKYDFTQRDVARMLGVGLSTVNRWAQHPLTYED